MNITPHQQEVVIRFAIGVTAGTALGVGGWLLSRPENRKKIAGLAHDFSGSIAFSRRKAQASAVGRKSVKSVKQRFQTPAPKRERRASPRAKTFGPSSRPPRRPARHRRILSVSGCRMH